MYIDSIRFRRCKNSGENCFICGKQSFTSIGNSVLECHLWLLCLFAFCYALDSLIKSLKNLKQNKLRLIMEFVLLLLAVVIIFKLMISISTILRGNMNTINKLPMQFQIC